MKNLFARNRVVWIAAAIGGLLLLSQAIDVAPAYAGTDKEAKRAFENGDFYQSITILVTKLRQKPDHQDNIALMEKVIPLFFDKAKRAAEKATKRKKWDKAVEEYNRIIEIEDVLAELPPVPKKVKSEKEKVPTTFEMPEDVYDLYEQSMSQAIEFHYTKAQNYEAEGTFKDAAVEYRLTREYDQGYKDAAIRYKACREKAMLKIAVMPFDDGTGSSYGALGDLLTQQLIAEAMGRDPEFLQFITRDYLDQMLADQGETAGSLTAANATQYGQQLGVHAFVFGKLMSIIENFPPDTDSSGTNAVEYYTKKGTVVKRCSYTVHKREGSVKVLGSFQVLDGATGIIKTSSNIDKTCEDGTSWVTYAGDEDAIPQEVLDQNFGERHLKAPGELVTQAINELGAELAANLVDTFK